MVREAQESWEPWWLETDVSSKITKKARRNMAKSLKRLEEDAKDLAEDLDENELSPRNIHVKANHAFFLLREGIFELTGAMNSLKTVVTSKAFSECSEEQQAEVIKTIMGWSGDMADVYDKTKNLDQAIKQLYAFLLKS